MSQPVPMFDEEPIRRELRRILAAGDRIRVEDLEPHDHQEQVAGILDLLRTLPGLMSAAGDPAGGS